ncbi:MAG: hypothetical protein AAF744_08980 [Pseudomonadota bacterium]
MKLEMILLFVVLGAGLGMKLAVILGSFHPAIGALVGAVVGFASLRIPGRGKK